MKECGGSKRHSGGRVIGVVVKPDVFLCLDAFVELFPSLLGLSRGVAAAPALD